MQESLPKGYVRLEEAVTITNRSEKTVRNWADKKLIGKRKWKGLALYPRSDLEAQMAREAEVQITQNPSGPPMVAQMGGAIATAIAQQFKAALTPDVIAETVALADKRRATLREAVRLGLRPESLEHRDVLNLDEARRLKGYSVKFMAMENAAGRLPFYKMPGRRGRHVLRRDLDRMEAKAMQLPTWT